MKKYDLMKIINEVEKLIMSYVDIDTSKYQIEIVYKNSKNIGSCFTPNYNMTKQNRYTHTIRLCENLNYFMKAKNTTIIFDKLNTFITDFCEEGDEEIVLYIFTFLHEFGHAYDFMKHSKYKKYQKLTHVLKNITILYFKNILINQAIHKQKYVELIADNFAYSYIEIIYIQLKEMGVI